MSTLFKTRAVAVTGTLLATRGPAAAGFTDPCAVRAPRRVVREHHKTIHQWSSNRMGTFGRKVLLSVFVGALVAIGGVAIAAGPGADPVIGTWKLNLAKSTFGGIPAYRSQIRTYSQSAGGITLEMTTVSADGKEVTTRATYKLNGKDYPSMGNPDFDSLSGLRIDANTVEFTLKKAGKPVGKIRRTVSKDRQTLTINFVITNADGIQTTALTVFDRH
jgi:hypothetical protein